MNSLVIYDGPGPLPQSVNFDSPVDGPVVLFLTGTAWTQTVGATVQIALVLDSNVVGSTSMCYANQAALHMTLRPTFIQIDDLAFGAHTIEIAPANGETTTDFNDYFQVVMLY
jgi:hypothetical protein